MQFTKIKMLYENQGKKLLKLARRSIETTFSNRELSFDEEKKEFREKLGVFVTLTLGGELRGCIGFPYATLPLAQAVVEAARAAAFHDPRFLPLKEEEMSDVRIEISVLTEPKEIKSEGQEILKEIKVGEDGLIVKYEDSSGLLLPQVASEFKWNALQFIEATCNKAGLPDKSWLKPKCCILKFQAQVFKE
jgi:AmmeMemoRadiSam system protein A